MRDPSPDDLRQELKFVASETNYHELVSWLQIQTDGFRRAYPPRRVNNVYFDRADYAMYHESISGVSSRIKVRYRWYGSTPYPDSGRLQVKVRKDRVGWKRNYVVNSIDGTTDHWIVLTRQIVDAVPPEGKGWLLEYAYPIMINRYERDYWASSDGTIRVTLDRDQVVYDQRYASVINVSRLANMPRTVVMEIKFSVKNADSVSRLVSTLPLPLSRHSKYCNAVKVIDGY